MRFLRALFDFSFSTFVTTSFIRLVYGIGMLLITLIALGVIIFGFTQSTGYGILAIIGAFVGFVALLTLFRIQLEIIVVVFRIAEYLRDMARQSG